MNSKQCKQRHFKITTHKYKFLSYANKDLSLLPASLSNMEIEHIVDLISTETNFDSAIISIMNVQFENIKREFIRLLNESSLEHNEKMMIQDIVSSWVEKEWRLINE